MVTPAAFSDAELSAARLEIDDPLAVLNLSKEKPPAELLPEIVGEYHLPKEHDFLWCCHCQGHHHRNGFLITNSTGKHYMLGSKCGPDHYGFSFKFARDQHTSRVRRKGVLDRLQAICVSALAVDATIREVLTSESLRLIDAKREEFWRASNGAFGAIATAVRSGNPLYETVSVRDLAAEQQRDARLAESETGPPIYQTDRISLGQPSGKGLLRHQYYCREHLLGLSGAIKPLLEMAEATTDKYSISELTKAVREAENAWQQAQDAIVEAESASMFFTAENLIRLERWSSSNRFFRLTRDGQCLVVIDAEANRTTIDPLPVLSFPRLPSIKPA